MIFTLYTFLAEIDSFILISHPSVVHRAKQEATISMSYEVEDSDTVIHIPGQCQQSSL